MRWMSLESLETSKFSLKSDVWSYAIVLTEVFTYGATPYGDLNTLALAYKLVFSYLSYIFIYFTMICSPFFLFFFFFFNFEPLCPSAGLLLLSPQ